MGEEGSDINWNASIIVYLMGICKQKVFVTFLMPNTLSLALQR